MSALNTLTSVRCRLPNKCLLVPHAHYYETNKNNRDNRRKGWEERRGRDYSNGWGISHEWMGRGGGGRRGRGEESGCIWSTTYQHQTRDWSRSRKGKGTKGMDECEMGRGCKSPLSPSNVISFFLQHFVFHSWNPQDRGEQRRQTESVDLHWTVNSWLVDQPIRIQMEILMFKCPIGDVD